uniref:Nonstructural protein 1 n=2 Tax=unclassified Protoparvovirus TaxID=1506575 RepID=A0A0G3Y607_9VIRU|nr:nonstructural protein 1 [Bat parvovirus BtBV_V3]AKM21312.1 nonstructural protein 1 [Bat parvovirus BtBV_V7]
MLGHPDSYIQNIAQPGGEQLIRATLDIVGLKMATEKTAYDLIMTHAPTNKSIKKLKAWKLLKKNNCNPYKAYHAIACCLNKQMGKRNTILLEGPASTGKSLLAQKIAHLVGNVGCYNAANVNFPFNDCTRKNLIWIEEAGNFGTQVNQFKAIMSGQAIRLDQKGKGSQTIEPTPVIMTTNEDITRVTVGCEYKPEHKQPIMDRCIHIHMSHRLPGDFGLLDDGEIPTIFKKLEEKGFKPTMSSYTARWGGPPTWNEKWDDEPKKLTPETPAEEETSSSQPVEKPSLAAALGGDEELQNLLDEIDDEEMWRATTGYGQELDATN